MTDRAMDRPDINIGTNFRRALETAGQAALAGVLAVRTRSAVLRIPRPVAFAGAVLFSSLAVTVSAADDNRIIFPSGNATTPAPAGGTGGGVASTMTLVLALVLAAVGAWMIWRNRRSPGAGRDARNLMLEETRSLGNRQYLVVASYEGKRFLLGVCPGRIDMLTPLDSRRGVEESGQ